MSTRRRYFVGLVAVAIAVLAALYFTHAQRPKPRIGWLVSVPSTSAATQIALQTFRNEMRTLGHREGENLDVVYRYAEQGPTQLTALAKELVDQKVAVIVTDGTPATRAAREATATIPIVMTVSAAPVEQGFAKSLGRPGGNITGLSMRIPELATKRLEILKQLVPKASRVGVLWRVNNETAVIAIVLRDTEAAAQALGFTLVRLDVEPTSADYARPFDAAVEAKVDAVVVLPDALFARDRAEIVAIAARSRLPTIYFEKMFVEAGGLASYGPDVGEMFRRSAGYVDRVLKGENPAELPIDQVEKYDFVINLGTAGALGLDIPQALRLRADKLIT